MNLRFLPILLLLPACYGPYDDNCTPTRIAARPADKVNLGALSRSAVLSARLTARGAPLSARTLTFDVQDDGATVYTTDGRTNSDGVASIDLKRADADALIALGRGDQFLVTFDRDGTYCGSSGNAAFHTVR